MKTVDRIASGLVEHRRITIPVLLVMLVALGAGVTQLQQSSGLQSFEVGTEEEAKLEYVESNFSTGPENGTVAQVVVRDDDVLDRETLVATLELQQSIRNNKTIAPTLREDRLTVGIANVIARAVIQQVRPGVTDPTLEQQVLALEAMNDSQIDRAAARILADGDGPRSDALAFMSTDYESGSTNASATMIAVFQQSEGVSVSTNAPDAIVDSQVAIEDQAAASDAGDETVTVGNGLITAEQRQSRQDTMSLLGPLALLFVLVTLAVFYRDLVDVFLSLVGIVLVQVWTFGTLGWVGIAFNPILIAIPVLLVGLSIDYGIHVFMRYRERRTRDEDTATAMATALAGVGVALLWVTVTTVVGFLSNLASPVAPIRDLGLISAIGIVGALYVFGLFLPPVKTGIDGLLERIGVDRTQEPVGTGGGLTAGLLSVGSTAAKNAPVVVLVLALVLTALTTAGAAQVSTSFDPEDNIVEDAPAWSDHLPEEVQPAEYTIRENLRYVNEHFVRQNSQVEILVEGNVTDPETLDDLQRAENAASNKSSTLRLANGEARTTSPLTVMERVAAQNETFERLFTAADTDGDGIPDENVTALYDQLYQTAPEQASSVLHHEDGEYVAARMPVSVNAEATGETTLTEMRDLANVLDDENREATATGRPVVNELIQDHLLGTLLMSLLITLVVVLALLSVVYRIVHDSATLGAVTLVPVLLVVSWIIGTMHVLGYPLSVLTTVVASITIGIGIDYSIHLSERFRAELDRQGSVEAAITTATRGTGSALLGSAMTTAIGFGTLGFAFFPVLQQFGVITAIMIGYAFLASVLVLPSLLVLWGRYVGMEEWTVSDHATRSTATETVDD
jgi:hydrophobe/amphiphile efflux-3 (HAE3) family protein